VLIVMELSIAGSIAGTAKVVEPCQHRQQAVQIFETAQITLGEIGLLGCHRSPPANMTVIPCTESNAQISCRTGVGCPRSPPDVECTRSAPPFCPSNWRIGKGVADFLDFIYECPRFSGFPLVAPGVLPQSRNNVNDQYQSYE